MKNTEETKLRCALRAEKFKAIMQAVGAVCLNGCPGPDPGDNMPSYLEFWAIPGKGLLVAQFWPDGGLTTCVDWPTGHKWEDLEACLTGEQDAARTDLLNAAKKASAFLQCHVKAGDPAQRMTVNPPDLGALLEVERALADAIRRNS